MSFNEPYFAPMSNYSNTNKGTPVNAVEAWLDQFPQKRAENKPNGGIIRTSPDVQELFLRPMSKSERKVVRAKAQREHRQALKNLAKQEARDAKEIAKQLAEWRKEDKRKDSQPKKMSKALQSFLNEIQTKGIFKVSDFNFSKVYLQKLVREARKLGYEIESVKAGRTITHYKLIGNKKPVTK